jgi:hypothetical protein
VLDGVATMSVDEVDNTETLDTKADWNMIPKYVFCVAHLNCVLILKCKNKTKTKNKQTKRDVKIYMMGFMPLNDYGRMRQVSHKIFFGFVF